MGGKKRPRACQTGSTGIVTDSLPWPRTLPRFDRTLRKTRREGKSSELDTHPGSFVMDEAWGGRSLKGNGQ